MKENIGERWSSISSEITLCDAICFTQTLDEFSKYVDSLKHKFTYFFPWGQNMSMNLKYFKFSKGMYCHYYNCNNYGHYHQSRIFQHLWNLGCIYFLSKPLRYHDRIVWKLYFGSFEKVIFCLTWLDKIFQ